MDAIGSVKQTPQGPRFFPAEKPKSELMLTEIPMQASQMPLEIDIRSYVGSDIRFTCQTMDDTWAWQVRDIEPVSG
jgi:hypothetical protein